MTQTNMEIVVFNSPEDAQKIQAYFPDTTVDENKLVSPKFDNRALKLAIGLESLTNYKILNSKLSENNWFLNQRNQALVLLLEINILTEVRLDKHEYRFLVDSSFDCEYREATGMNEIPLTITPVILDFANRLEKQNLYPEPIQEIENCACQVNLENPRICHLVIIENGLQKIIKFYPTRILLYEA
jgi:hypothetical protein